MDIENFSVIEEEFDNRVRKIMPAQKTRRVRKQPRPHRIALPRDRIRPRPRLPNVPGQQRQIDNRLRRPHPLVTLIHPHRPPKRHPLPRLRNHPCQRLNLLHRNPRPLALASGNRGDRSPRNSLSQTFRFEDKRLRLIHI